MAGVLAKARIAALSLVHGVLDKVIDMNSVEAVKQYIRDLETSRDNLSDSVAEARGNEMGARRDIQQLTSRKEKLNHQIDTLLTDNDQSNDHLANTLEAELVGVEETLTSRQEELTSTQETVQALDQALSALNTKHETMVHQLRRLETMDRSAKAKESAAAAIRGAAAVSSVGSSVSVDDVAACVQRRSDVADQKFKSAMNTFASSTEQDSAMASVAARLAERKKRLTSSVSAPAVQ